MQIPTKKASRIECDPCTRGWLRRESLHAISIINATQLTRRTRATCRTTCVSRRTTCDMAMWHVVPRLRPTSIRTDRRWIIPQEVARAAGCVIRVRNLPGRRPRIEVVILIVGGARSVEDRTHRVIDALIARRIAISAAEAFARAAAWSGWIIERAGHGASVAENRGTWRPSRLRHVARFARIAAARPAHATRSHALAAGARHRERHGQRRVQSLHQIVPPSNSHRRGSRRTSCPKPSHHVRHGGV